MVNFGWGEAQRGNPGQHTLTPILASRGIGTEAPARIDQATCRIGGHAFREGAAKAPHAPKTTARYFGDRLAMLTSDIIGSMLVNLLQKCIRAHCHSGAGFRLDLVIGPVHLGHARVALETRAMTDQEIPIEGIEGA